MNKSIATMLTIILLASQSAAQVTHHTIYSTADNDGNIWYNDLEDEFDSFLFWSSLIVGDLYNMTGGGMNLVRAYLEFDLSEFENDGTVLEAVLAVYQERSVGNSVIGAYPVWNISGGDTIFCKVDHVIYGDLLNTEDWSAGDSGDPQTLNSKIGAITTDGSIGYKTLDVTEYVIEDMEAGRTRIQLRISFDLQKSDDGFSDYIVIGAGEKAPRYDAPHLKIKHTYSMLDIGRVYPPIGLIRNYPNPFNSQTSIPYILHKEGHTKLTIYDSNGNKVITLIDKIQCKGHHQIKWNGKNMSGEEVASGLYFYRAEFENIHQQSGKMILIR